MSAQLPELLLRNDVTIPGQFRTALLADMDWSVVISLRQFLWCCACEGVETSDSGDFLFSMT